MITTMQRPVLIWKLVEWIARITSVLALVPVLMILVGEPGTGPGSARGWLYLAFFPIGFAAGYLLAWRWPTFGGLMSLACMVISLVVVGRVFPLQPYLFWSLLCIPGALFILAGRQLAAGRSSLNSRKAA